MNFLEKYTYAGHVLGWLLVLLIPALLSPFSNERLNAFFLIQSLPFVLSIGMFYLNLGVLMPRFLKKGLSLWFLILILFLALVLILRAETFVFNLVTKANEFYFGGRPHFALPRPLALVTILMYVLMIGMSSMIVLRNDRRKEKELKQQIEFEKVAAELAVLKLQISPHFLFNTLNNIRWLARQKSDLTEDAIVKLSQLLRYMIYQAKNEKVPLEQEVAHLQNYIDLQKIRLTQPQCVSFICEGAIQGRMIEPLLFIPFVENAFKYGYRNEGASDLVFKIKLEGDKLFFESHNTIFDDHETKGPDASGIGIQNVQKRLALNYPNQHDLRIHTEGGMYSVHLSIQNI